MSQTGEGVSTPNVGGQSIILTIFPENCMKLKQNWAKSGAHVPSALLDAPIFGKNSESNETLHCDNKWVKIILHKYFTLCHQQDAMSYYRISVLRNTRNTVLHQFC